MADEGERPSGEPGGNPDIIQTKTTIDALLELLRTKGRVDLNTVAVALNIDPRVIENWAKVLEAGGLIKITYEVGKMYMAPITLAPEQQADVKTRTDATTFILQEDLAVERIETEKFAKNIEDLNVTITNIERLYQKKMPDVQKMLAELERAYAPVESKRKDLKKIKDDADLGMSEVNKKMDLLYAKLNSFTAKSSESELSDKLNKLNAVLKNIEDAQAAMNEMTKSKNKFFETIQRELDNQIKELRNQLNSSRVNIEQGVKTTNKQLTDLMLSMKDQSAAAKQVAKEAQGSRKEFESAKRYLDVVRDQFIDKYTKVHEELEKDTVIVQKDSEKIDVGIASIKQNFGEVSKLDDDIRRWRKDLADISKDIVTTKSEIIKLTTQLNTLAANKNMTVETKAKGVGELTKRAEDNKDRVENAKKVIKKTADEMRERAEGGGVDDA